MKNLLFGCFCFFLIIGCGSIKIIDKPIVFNEEREQLSLQYIKDRYLLERDTSTIDPKIIVLHWTAIPTLEASFNAFNNPRLPDSRDEIRGAGSLNVSTHFLIDRDGKIFRLMPETLMGRHVIGLNYNAIGVENVGGTKTTPLTEDQLKANIWLVNYLKLKYDIQYLIGHYEYTNFENHELWLEQNEDYRTQKTDPGIEFMTEVREATKKLNFKQLPKKN